MDFWNPEVISAAVFIAIVGLLLYLNRSKVMLQRLVSIPGIRVPVLYLMLVRTKFGIRLMDRVSSRYREAVKLFGYCCIGIGFLGMLVVSFLMLYTLYLIIARPEVESGISLVLPFTNIPGYGYLSFWHFVISIFVLATLHEFAHGVVARAHELEVKSSGFGVMGLIVPLFPLAFVEPDENALRKKPDVIQYSVFAAGATANIMLAFIMFLIFSFIVTPMETRLTDPAGLTFEVINASHPAYEAGMVSATLVSFNGNTINDYSDFMQQIVFVRPGEEITLGTTEGSFTITTAESPDQPGRAFIGIRPVQNERVFKEQYIAYSGAFSWGSGLVRWLFMLNLLVGLFNFLPLAIVDGGRMFHIAAKRIWSEDKGNRAVAVLAVLFLAIILLGLWKSYGGGLLGILNSGIGWTAGLFG